jgi:hypothetical protein
VLIILYFLSVIIVTVGLVSVHVARRRTNLTVGTCILLFTISLCPVVNLGVLLVEVGLLFENDVRAVLDIVVIKVKKDKVWPNE